MVQIYYQGFFFLHNLYNNIMFCGQPELDSCETPLIRAYLTEIQLQPQMGRTYSYNYRKRHFSFDHLLGGRNKISGDRWNSHNNMMQPQTRLDDNFTYCNCTAHYNRCGEEPKKKEEKKSDI